MFLPTFVIPEYLGLFLAFLQSHYTWTKKFTERISIDNFIFGIKSEYNGKGDSVHCQKYFY